MPLTALLFSLLLFWPDGARDARAQIEMPTVGRVSLIGVRLAEVTPERAAALKLEKAEGALVEAVNPESPAARSGLQQGDVIVSFDGERVRSAAHLTRLVRETPPGRQVSLGVVRQGGRKELAITPEAGSWFDPRFGDGLEGMMENVRERVSGRARSRLGAQVQAIDGQLADYFGTKTGLLVAAVEPGTPAARAGLEAGDVIVSVNGEAVSTPRDLRAALPPAGQREKVTLGIVRDRKALTLTVAE